MPSTEDIHSICMSPFNKLPTKRRRAAFCGRPRQIIGSYRNPGEDGRNDGRRAGVDELQESRRLPGHEGSRVQEDRPPPAAPPDPEGGRNQNPEVSLLRPELTEYLLELYE